MTESAEQPRTGLATDHQEPIPEPGASSLADGVRHPMHPGWLKCERVGGWIVNAIVLPVALIAL